MNLVPLSLPDGSPTDVSICTECKIPQRGTKGEFHCCGPRICEECGKEARQYHIYCDACENVRDEARELARFEKAEKVTAFIGMLSWGDEYYDSIEEILEHCEDEDIPPPKYVWATKGRSFVNFDMDDIANSLADNAYEDFDINDLTGANELKVALATFCATNTGVQSYLPDYTRAVLMPEQDPTPYCSHCRAMTAEHCDCGPISKDD